MQMPGKSEQPPDTIAVMRLTEIDGRKMLEGRLTCKSPKSARLRLTKISDREYCLHVVSPWGCDVNTDAPCFSEWWGDDGKQPPDHLQPPDKPTSKQPASKSKRKRKTKQAKKPKQQQMLLDVTESAPAQSLADLANQSPK